MKAMGYGKGYQSPHGTSREWVKTECLPDELRGARFYHPTEQGYEKTVAERVNLWRKWKQEAGK
jgi:putative ATPase